MNGYLTKRTMKTGWQIPSGGHLHALQCKDPHRDALHHSAGSVPESQHLSGLV